MNFPVHPLAFIDGIGGPEMMLILVIVLMLFGGQKLPELARGLGKSMKEFKKAATGVEEEFKRALNEDEQRKSIATTPVITSAQPVPALSNSTDYSSAPDDGSSPPAETVAPSPVETVAVAPTLPPTAPVIAAPEPVKPAPAPAAPRRGRADV